MERELRDELWLASGGLIVKQLRTGLSRRLILDFSQVTWADPTPLLSIGCAIAERRARGGVVEIDLGFPRRDEGNRFLIFLARQGFLAAFAEHAEIKWRGELCPPGQGGSVDTQLRGLRGIVTFREAECVPATICRPGALDAEQLDRLVETLVTAAHPRIAGWLGGNARRRGLMLHRIRVILTETLDNIREHAYGDRIDGHGFGGVYARIRAGAAEEPGELGDWERARRAEARFCPALGRCRNRKRPGWLEIFVCDVGGGLTRYLGDYVEDDRSPLHGLTSRLFRDAVSRYREDRTARGKTGITGLQLMGKLLTAGVGPGEQGDFVRIYSSGEWVGEHLPWQADGGYVGHRNARLDPRAQFPPGTVLHLAIEPPPATAQDQLKLYPGAFKVPGAEGLEPVREVLREPSKALFTASFNFIDLYVSEQTPNQSGLGAAELTRLVTRPIVMIRPSRSQRKTGLVSQLAAIIQTHPDVTVTDIILVDVPWASAIEFASVIESERSFHRVGLKSVNLYVVSQDWVCAGFTLSTDSRQFSADHKLTGAFLQAGPEKASAALVAAALRERDSRLFWSQVGDAYLNEEVIWGEERDEPARRIRGYLDVALAVSQPGPHDAAKRALRRAVSAFGGERVYAADELVRPLVFEEFEVEDASMTVNRASDGGGVLAGSVLGTGSTARRFLRRRGPIRGSAHLFKHPDLESSDPDLQSLLALEWPARAPMESRTRPYQRIPNTPFIIRGGEGAIPLPRFSDPNGPSEGASLYGQSPAEAYERWQQLGLLRLGHWTYSLHHDLLTLRLMDALEFDAAEGGPMVQWFLRQIAEWREESSKANLGCLVVYPQHVVTDRLLRAIQSDSTQSGLRFFPLPILRAWSRSPIVISPMTRELIGREFRRSFARGGRVIFVDDGIVSGGTLSQITQAIEGLWEVTKVDATATLVVSSLAIVDRTGLPTQRALVDRDLTRHRRFWRWDVPPLGHEGSCALCAMRSRWAEMQNIIGSATLRGRAQQWLEQWAPVPVEDARFDMGVPPRTLPQGDRTRFAIERDPQGDEIVHHVNHLISTSRASIAAEIARSTTRKDYPLRKARGEVGASGVPLDVLTRIEILACEILLFQGELSPADKLDRLATLLDLLWKTQETGITTALAGMALELDPALATELWIDCERHVDAAGFPHDDALIAAIALHNTAGRPILERVTHADWALFDLCRQPPNQYREPLARIFRVIGWDPQSIHRNHLTKLLTSGTPDPKTASQISLMLEGFAKALRELRPAVTEGVDLEVEADADALGGIALNLRKLLAERPDAVDSNESIDSPADSQDGIERKIARATDDAYRRLFREKKGVRARYTAALTAELESGVPAEFLMKPALDELSQSWAANVRHKGEAMIRRWPNEPRIEFAPSNLPAKKIRLYFDTYVRKAVTEILSNVMHRSEPIPRPWVNTEAEDRADMWGRLTADGDCSSVTLELVNAMDDPHPVQPQSTFSQSHLRSLGGAIASEIDVTGLLRVTIQIPTVAGLAKS